MEAEHSMPVMDAIHGRRAVRSYTAETVSESTVRKLLEAAVQAPTAMHLEPWAFVIVQDVALLRRLSDLAKAGFTRGAAGHHELVRPAGAARPASHLDLLSNPDFNIFYDASTLIVVCGKPTSPFVTADCWLAAENLMLAACALGLATCPIGFAVPALNTPEVKAELHVPPDVTAVAPMIVGRPRGSAPPVPRKDPEILCWKLPKG